MGGNLGGNLGGVTGFVARAEGRVCAVRCLKGLDRIAVCSDVIGLTI
jgi:hypothetical protein